MTVGNYKYFHCGHILSFCEVIFMNEQKINQLFAGLSPEQQKQVMQILSDKTRTQQILQTPQAQALMKKLTGENRNG